jgi:Zn-dependent M28 family amino/carboxypeptidase
MAEGPVRIHLTNTSPLTGPTKVPNVVAEIRGRERPDEWVLVGAHLDAWDLAPSAQDNGTGVTEVLETARILTSLGIRPRRTIRFSLFGGEEEGLFGSRAYVKRHVRELDACAGVVVSDHGAGAPQGWWLDARRDLVERFRPLAEDLFAPLGTRAISTDFNCNTDHCPFAVAGAPTVNLKVEDETYMKNLHSPADTVDKIEPVNLALGVANVATAAYLLAEMPERLAPRRDRASVEAALEEAHALDDLVREGIWPPAEDKR